MSTLNCGANQRRRYRCGLPPHSVPSGRAFLLLMITAIVCVACDKGPDKPNSADLAVLAASAEQFTQAEPGEALQFPRDHGSHDDYRIEWWYLTANLEDAYGTPFGAQWTLFRIAQRAFKPGESSSKNAGNPWQSPQIYMGHFAISTPETHSGFQRYARGGEHGGSARAGATAKPFRAWLDDWFLRSVSSAPARLMDQQRTPGTGGGAQPWLPLELHAKQGNHAVDLRLSSDQSLVLQGDKGFSRKHPNGAGSYYYSHPFLQASGELTIDGETVKVKGQAWLDREWSSQFLQEDQLGWDWFSLHLDSGEKLMLFRLRSTTNTAANFRHGVLIAADGSTRTIPPEELGFEPLAYANLSGRRVPVRWRITLIALNRELLIKPLHPRQWMDVDFPYWEGYVIASGDDPGETGRGYLEMVGYSLSPTD